MKRVIKFRAWDSKSNKWFDDFVLYPNGKIAGVNHAYGNIHIMQFTGLLDKNGKEIYEGDIVRAKDMSRNHYPEPYVGDIKMGNFNGAWQIGRTPWLNLMNFSGGLVPEWDFEVIGNIHENKDLL